MKNQSLLAGKLTCVIVRYGNYADKLQAGNYVFMTRMFFMIQAFPTFYIDFRLHKNIVCNLIVFI